jgi:hypothetical protein
MAPQQLQDPAMAHSSASVHSRESQEFAPQNEDNPLETRSGSIQAPPDRLPSSSVHATPSIMSNSSIQATPSIMERDNPIERLIPLAIADTHSEGNDEPPPPYEEPNFEDAPQIAPVEYSCDNSPQLLVAPPPDWSELEAVVPPPRNPARLSGSELTGSVSVQSPASPQTLNDSAMVPRPLQVRSPSSNGSIPHRPIPSHTTGSLFSSAKAREAGFEILPETPGRTNSDSSIIILPQTETLKHTREAGKLTAYLVPLPKPRLKGIRPEDIPTRFMVYTPPLPPLSKPAPGEKESHWHKTQRTWQEDVRKATMTNASKATWKGMKAKGTILIGKGVNMTRSSNVEFLDRVSGGTISSTTESEDLDTENGSRPTSPASSLRPTTSTSGSISSCPRRSSTSTSLDKDLKPKSLEDLTLIYPPSLDLSPEDIRAEFVSSLLRTRSQSRKDAIVASSLIPFAAGVDACLAGLSLGGLTQVASVWTYTSIKGASTSKKVSQGLLVSAEEAIAAEEKAEEIKGCTCGHHEQDFGPVESVKGKGKKKGPLGISLKMLQNTHIEIFRRYLDLACLSNRYELFPTIEEMVGDVDEGAILQAIGWQPTQRHGRDLEMDFKGRVETLTSEQDKEWQVKEAKEDIRRICKKAAAEWVGWCKTFQKDFQKDPESAVKK